MYLLLIIAFLLLLLLFKQVERREDEEQTVKEQEIFDILVAAGYFRARIKGLSAFDKIVGGMTWCIVSCDYDVEVDLLFNESLSIGQKMYDTFVLRLPRTISSFIHSFLPLIDR